MAKRGGSVVPYIFVGQELRLFYRDMDCLLTHGPNISPHINKNHLFQFTEQQSGLVLLFEASSLNFTFSFSF